jgi:NAD(P)-dependent dehydrogenase (short-subunit alcohol dehydrogenase family)
VTEVDEQGGLTLSQPFTGLVGRTAVVTGSARGIGERIAAMFLELGMTVLLVDRDGPALDLALSRFVADGQTNVRSVMTDLSSDDGIPALAQAVATLPALAVWVNNAGRVSHQSVAEVDLETFEAVLRDNTSSAIRGSQVAFRQFRRQDTPGAIVNITSLVTDKVLPERLSYATSKAALENVTRYAAQEWGRYGIRVNAVSPGYIDTRLTAWPDDDPRQVAKRATLDQIALPRAGTVDDIAHTVLYLASPLSSYVTGMEILVDGGWHLI